MMRKNLPNDIVIKLEIDDSETESEPEQQPDLFYAKRVRHNNVIGPWKPCIKLNSDEKRCTIKYSDGKQKDIGKFDIASNEIPSHDDIKAIGTRVIAKHRNAYLPYTMNQNKRINLIAGRNSDFFSGIIARAYEADDKYCVFFDDGVVQLVERQHIRRVEDNTYEHAHWNARSYFRFYVSQIQYEAKPTAQLEFVVELNGSWQLAKVVKIDRILALLHFQKANRFEWIYLGSPRIPKIFRMYITEKKLDGIIEFKTYSVCRTSDVILLDSCNQDEDRSEDNTSQVSESTSTEMNQHNGCSAHTGKKHTCSNECVRSENGVKLESIGLFRRPILCGWGRNSRHNRFYRTPCGLCLYSNPEIENYLAVTKSKLRIDSFDFSKNIDPSKTYDQNDKISDISRGAEKIPISVSQEMALDERSFNYVTNYNFDYVDVESKSNLERKGCECTDNCRDKTKCSCWQLTVQRMLGRSLNKDDLKNNKNVGYKNKRLENIVSSGIVECGANCKCCADTCQNRVVQHGLQHELDLFKTSNRGWGVRTRTDLPPGIFICNYAGDVLENAVADKRSTKYQFKVPALAGEDDPDDDYEPNQVPQPKRSKYPDAYDVFQAIVNYFPPIPGYNAKIYPESELTDGKYGGGYVIDAMNHGNIARFFNHSCEPNLFVQGVFVGDDDRFPEIAFFTQSQIKAGEELTFDYRYELIEGRETACLCGSDKCRHRLT